MDFRDYTISDFAKGIAGENTIAGGGSVSALAGAYGAALISMVCRKTIQNKKYADKREKFEGMLEDVQAPMEFFLDGIQEDINSFSVFEDAMAMPKDTEEQKAARKSAMQEGLKAAARAPRAIAELAESLMPACLAIVAEGNVNAASDALAGIMLMRVAILGSVYNMRINAQSIKDEEFTAELLKRADELEKTAFDMEARIMQASDLSRR